MQVKIQVDVIVMAGGEAPEPIMDWRFGPDKNGELCASRANRSEQTPTELWEELTHEINRRALNGDHAPVEVFLYLRDGLRVSIDYHGVLKRMVADARNHALGGNIYVVWDDVRSLDASFFELDSFNKLVKCFRSLLRERVADIIEIPRPKRSRGEASLDELQTIIRGRLDSSQARQEDLKRLVSRDGWGYALPPGARFSPEARFLESFLSEFVSKGSLPSSSPDRLIIFDDSLRFGVGDVATLFAEVGKAHPEGRRVVAATLKSRWDILEHRRDTQTPDAQTPPPEVILCRRALEAVYALLLLNDVRRAETGREQSGAGAAVERKSGRAAASVEVKKVKLNSSATFSFPAVQSPPRLLITTAFDGRESSHRLAEAAEIGALIREITFDADVEVHQYVGCESFPRLLESRQFTAWIHISHGSEDEDEDGFMYDSQLKMYLPPSRWLNCFIAYRKRSLKLALFSVCYSSSVAHQFARAGVGVAIGFRKEPHTDATKILTRMVVPAAMRFGSDQGTILEAFHDACESLAATTFNQGVSYIEACPVAFRVDRV